MIFKRNQQVFSANSIDGLRAGYTIVETMIFLAVSGALFVSVVLLLSGQQAKTEFSQAIRDINSQIQDIINDVSTGYYPNTNNFSCSAPPSGGVVTIGGSPSNNQGANTGCIFIGRAIQFAVSGTNGQDFKVYTVAGRQLVGGPGTKEVAGFDDTIPKVVSINNETNRLQNGLKVRKMNYKTGATLKPIGGAGFFTTFGKYAGADLLSGAQEVNLLPLKDAGQKLDINDTASTAENAINNISDGYATPPRLNPDGGVIICFESGGTQQFGIITIGSNGRSLSSKLAIVNNSPVPPECA